MVAGTFNGTGAAVYLCLGFIPDFVTLYNLENAEDYRIKWSKHMRTAEYDQGVLFSGDDDQAMDVTPLTSSSNNGIEPYEGGDLLTSSNQTSTTYGEGVYLGWDGQDGTTTDYRTEGTGADIDTWTLGNSTNRTGNWNDVCNTTYIGEGSRIMIGDPVKNDKRWYNILALTSNGEAANEVTLDRAAPSGTIYCITGMYDLAPIATGKLTPAGILVNDTTLNVDGEYCMFEAGVYDN